MDPPLVEDVVSTLLANAFARGITSIFFLGESNMIITIPDDDTSHQLEGTEKLTTEPSREPKEEKEDVTGLSGGGFRKNPKVDLQTAPSSTSSHMRDITVSSTPPMPPVAPGVYLPKWTLTPTSLLIQHFVTRKWSRHSFPKATIDAMELLGPLLGGCNWAPTSCRLRLGGIDYHQS